MEPPVLAYQSIARSEKRPHHLGKGRIASNHFPDSGSKPGF
jgi:hypothetical protein